MILTIIKTKDTEQDMQRSVDNSFAYLLNFPVGPGRRGPLVLHTPLTPRYEPARIA